MSIHYTYTIHKQRMCNHMKHKIIQAKTSEKIWKEFELPKPYVNTSETSFKKYLIASKKKKKKKKHSIEKMRKREENVEKEKYGKRCSISVFSICTQINVRFSLPLFSHHYFQFYWKIDSFCVLLWLKTGYYVYFNSKNPFNICM